MTIHKTQARLLDAAGTLIGEGRAYVHLRLPEVEPQPARGTLSLDWWNEASRVTDARLELADGPTLALSVESDQLSGCINGRILRYDTTWPGSQTPLK